MTQATPSPAPFADFAPRAPLDNPRRGAITAAYRRPEPEAVAPLGRKVCKWCGGLRHGGVFRWFGRPNEDLDALLAMILGLLMNKCSKMVGQAE